MYSFDHFFEPMIVDEELEKSLEIQDEPVAEEEDKENELMPEVRGEEEAMEELEEEKRDSLEASLAGELCPPPLHCRAYSIQAAGRL